MSSKKLSPTSRPAGRDPRRDADDELSICRRLAELRVSLAGPRGQSRFAAQLGLTASTYANYEKTRVPPPTLLVRVCELTGADLVWLVTGKATSPAVAPAASGQVAPWAGNPQHGAIIQRVAQLLTNRPADLAALAAFLDLLEEKARVEQSATIVADHSPVAPPVARKSGWPDFGRWVPVFGRASAGLARFWREIADPHARVGLGPSQLDLAIQQAAQLSDADSRLAVLEETPVAGLGSKGGRRGGKSANRVSAAHLRVRLVQLSEPLTDYQLTEFLSLESPDLADRYRPLFGLRLDGDSMAPMFADGTIVLCSPNEPARAGGPAVVRLAGQIGLTCKLYRPHESVVRLVPANDKYPAQEFPAEQIDWALAVLGSVRVDR
jgi:hypothetical protein